MYVGDHFYNQSDNENNGLPYVKNSEGQNVKVCRRSRKLLFYGSKLLVVCGFKRNKQFLDLISTVKTYYETARKILYIVWINFLL